MFAVIEVGLAVGPGCSWPEAIAGVLAEAVYFSLASWAVAKILKPEALAQTDAPKG